MKDISPQSRISRLTFLAGAERSAEHATVIYSQKEAGLPMATIDREITELLHRLPEVQQQRVLAFARELAEAKLQGIPGADLLKFGGCISTDDLQRMRDAIEEGCEAVNLGEW